jgi:hypothetical protein
MRRVPSPTGCSTVYAMMVQDVPAASTHSSACCQPVICFIGFVWPKTSGAFMGECLDAPSGPSRALRSTRPCPYVSSCRSRERRSTRTNDRRLNESTAGTIMVDQDRFGRNKRLIARMCAPATTARVLAEIDLEIGMPLISPARRLIAFQGTAVRDPVWLWQEGAARSDGCPRCEAIAQRVNFRSDSLRALADKRGDVSGSLT